MIKAWTDDAWSDYLWWQANDAKTVSRINAILKDAERDPFRGIGKPEPLRHEFKGWWSRRIDSANRLIYKVADNTLVVLSCKDHYAK